MRANTQAPTQTVTTRFDLDTLSRLNEVSQMQQRPRSDIIKEAVQGYLEAMIWLETEVKKGLDDLDAGRTVSHDDLKEEFRELGINVD